MTNPTSTGTTRLDPLLVFGEIAIHRPKGGTATLAVQVENDLLTNEQLESFRDLLSRDVLGIIVQEVGVHVDAVRSHDKGVQAGVTVVFNDDETTVTVTFQVHVAADLFLQDIYTAIARGAKYLCNLPGRIVLMTDPNTSDELSELLVTAPLSVRLDASSTRRQVSLGLAGPVLGRTALAALLLDGPSLLDAIGGYNPATDGDYLRKHGVTELPEYRGTHVNYVIGQREYPGDDQNIELIGREEEYPFRLRHFPPLAPVSFDADVPTPQPGFGAWNGSVGGRGRQYPGSGIDFSRTAPLTDPPGSRVSPEDLQYWDTRKPLIEPPSEENPED